MSNGEGYSDRTADTAIARVSRQEKTKKEESTNGAKRRPKVKKSNKTR